MLKFIQIILDVGKAEMIFLIEELIETYGKSGTLSIPFGNSGQFRRQGPDLLLTDTQEITDFSEMSGIKEMGQDGVDTIHVGALGRNFIKHLLRYEGF